MVRISSSICAAEALREVLGQRLDETAQKAFRRALSQKGQSSYQGDYYTVATGDAPRWS